MQNLINYKTAGVQASFSLFELEFSNQIFRREATIKIYFVLWDTILAKFKQNSLKKLMTSLKTDH